MNDPFLLHCFTDFYRSVAMIKKQIMDREKSWAHGDLDDAEYDEPDRKTVADQLLLILDKQAARVAGSPESRGNRLYQDARYVMVALADEVFLGFEWSGREEWAGNLLEEEVFHSQGSGELFFQRLDALLLTSGPGTSDLARVYLMALALGFRGKFQHHDPDHKIDAYLNRLYVYIFGREPDAHPEKQQLFPQCLQAAISKSKPKWLPTLRRWRIFMALLVLTGILITHGLWLFLTDPLREVLQNIIAYGNQ